MADVVNNMPNLVYSKLANYYCCLGELGDKYVCAQSHGARPDQIATIRQHMKAVQGAIKALEGYPITGDCLCQCTTDEVACGIIAFADHFCADCGCVPLTSPPAPCTSFSCKSFFFDNDAGGSYMTTEFPYNMGETGDVYSYGFWLHPTQFGQRMYIAGSQNTINGFGWWFEWTADNKVRFVMDDGEFLDPNLKTIIEMSSSFSLPISGFPWIYVGFIKGQGVDGGAPIGDESPWKFYINGYPVPTKVINNQATTMGVSGSSMWFGNVEDRVSENLGWVGHQDEMFRCRGNIGDQGFLATYGNGQPVDLDAVLTPLGFPPGGVSDAREYWFRADGDSLGAEGVSDNTNTPTEDFTATLTGTGAISDERP